MTRLLILLCLSLASFSSATPTRHAIYFHPDVTFPEEKIVRSRGVYQTPSLKDYQKLYAKGDESFTHFHWLVIQTFTTHKQKSEHFNRIPIAKLRQIQTNNGILTIYLKGKYTGSARAREIFRLSIQLGLSENYAKYGSMKDHKSLKGFKFIDSEGTEHPDNQLGYYPLHLPQH
jgi:hypothetical protein